MTRQHTLANAMPWVAAITVAFAAPTFFLLFLPPLLAATPLLARPDVCLNRSTTP